MSKPLDLGSLRSMDYVLTTSVSALAIAIRAVSAGWKKTFDWSIGTHIGRVVTLNCQGVLIKEIAEMVPMKDDQESDLKLHSFARYNRDGGPWIVAVLRAHYYDDDALRNAAERRIVQMWIEGKEYDTSGCVKHKFPFLQDVKEKFYCSELSEYVDQMYGFSPTGWKKGDNVTPWDIQKSSLLSTIWKRS